jgi:hypothetical protein
MMGRLEPSELPEPSSDSGYTPGQFVRSDKYDRPEGSQSSQPSRDYNEAEPSESKFRMYQDPDDPEFALIEGVRPNYDLSASVPANQVDDDDDYVIVPQD